MAEIADKELADWAEVIRQAVRADGRSAYAIAKLAKCDQAHLRRWLKGECGMAAEIAGRIGQVVGCRLIRQ
jgi:hypothetical protein